MPASHNSRQLLNHTNQIVSAGILLEMDIRIMNTIFGQDCLDRVIIQTCQRDRRRYVYPSFLLLFEVNCWWFFIESYAESFQLFFNEPFIS